LKARTIIGKLGRPPCLECFRTGHDCNLAGSRRGGDYTHLRKPRTRRAVDASSQSVAPATWQNPHNANKSIDCSQEKLPICSELKNPLDALQILAEAAVNDPDPSIESVCTPESADGEYHLSPHDDIALSDRPQALTQGLGAFTQRPGQDGVPATGIKNYELVMSGAIDVETILNLIQQ
jgi:hypothetical protein